MRKFTWKMPKMGYRWLAADRRFPEPSSEWGLRLEPIVYDFNIYHPFETPGMFRTFADLELTPEAILPFANKYGHLGDDPAYPNDLGHPRDSHVVLEALGVESHSEEELRQPQIEWIWEQRFTYSLPEPLWRWTKAIERMRGCVKRWDRCRDGDAKVDDEEDLVDEVNEQLESESMSILLRRQSPARRLFRLEYLPRDLLAAMWIQLAQAIAEVKDLRQCPGCGEWFEVSSKQQQRASRKYCQDSCKSQHYRDRKLSAVRMAKAKKSIAEIAEALETEPSTVEVWLRQHEKDGGR